MGEDERDGEALSLVSACLLVFIAASPLYLAHPDKGPALSPLYTSACLAFLAGQVAGRALKPIATAGVRARFRALLLAVVGVEALVLPEWALLGEYVASLTGGEAFGYLGDLRLFIRAAQPYALPGICCLAGAFASLPAVAKKGEGAPAPDRRRPVTPAALAMCVGYAPRIVWSQLFPTSCPGLVAGLAAYGVLVACLVKHWRAAGLPAAAFGSSFALGMLLWALLTRVFSVWETAALAASPLIVMLLAVAAAAALRYLRARRAAQAVKEAEPDRGGVAPLPEKAAAGLTVREREVVEGALAGKKSTEIASELGVSASTVRGTLSKAYKKVGVANLEELKGLARPSADAASRAKTLRPVTRPVQRALLAAGALPLLPVVMLGGWGEGQPLVMGVGFALLAWAITSLSLGRRTLSCSPEQRWAVAAVLLAAGDAAALLSLAWRIVEVPVAMRPFGPALEFAAGLGITLSFLTLLRVDGAFADQVPTPLCACFALGLCFEELWRSAYVLAGLLGLFPFAVVAGLLSLKLLVFERPERLRFDVVIAAVALLGLAGLLRPWFACVLALLPVAALAVKQRKDGHFSPAAACAGCLSLGCGALAGVYVMNLFGDWCLRWQAFPLSNLGRGLLSMSPAAVSLLLSLPGIVSACLACGREASRLSGLSVPSESERIQGFLVSKGLNAVESQTASLIADGLTTRQIAGRICYSVGAVNSARRGAYAKLDVRSKAELLALFAQFRSR